MRDLATFNIWYLPFLNVPYSPFQKNEIMESWQNWLRSNLRRLLNWRGPGTQPQSSKMFRRFLKIIFPVCICKLAKFGDLMICGSNIIYSNTHLVSCTNTHHGFTDLVNHRMFTNTKKWISWERDLTFLQNKNVFNLCLRWHILREYGFVVDVTFKSMI